MTEARPAFAGIDPEQLIDDATTDDATTDDRTYTHETPDHCEADAAGRAIAGVTDSEGRVLLLVNPEEEHAILPNVVVEDGADFTTAVTTHLHDLIGLDVTIESVERVRRVTHVVEDGDDGDDADDGRAADAGPHTTHHVVFAAAVGAAEPQLESLCDDNPWTIGWCDAVPFAVEDDGSGVIDDLELFVERVERVEGPSPEPAEVAGAE